MGIGTDIDEADDLLRRVFHYHIKPDTSVSSAAFMTRSSKPDPSCSVSLARITPPERLLQTGLEGQRVVSLPVRVPLRMNLKVTFSPEENDPGHCLIEGLGSKQQCVELARASHLVL